MRWIPVTERLPEGADAVSCEAWCAAEEPGEVAGPCIMGYDADAPEEDRWHSREDTGCWEPGPVTHWRPRPEAPWQEDMLMGVIGADGHKHCLYRTRAEEDAAVARSPLKVAEDLMRALKRGAHSPAKDLPQQFVEVARERLTKAEFDIWLKEARERASATPAPKEHPPMPHSRDGEWGPANKDGSMPMD